MPTPPRPTTMTLCPGSGGAALSSAPPPVSTAQPNTAATSGGTSSSTATTERVSTTAWVANAETPEVVVNRDAVAREPATASQELAGGVADGPGPHGIRPRSRSRGTRPQRQERHHHLLADGQVGHVAPERDDAPARLVAEQHGHGAGPVAVDDGQVGVADTRRGDLDQHLTGPGASSSSSPTGRAGSAPTAPAAPTPPGRRR